tara:strand:- start:198 stop:314 length:117 start_codon:yes stop_codon:yes gene_type:complete
MMRKILIQQDKHSERFLKNWWEIKLQKALLKGTAIKLA